MSFSAGKNNQNNVNVTEAQTLQNKTLDATNTVSGSPINNSTITGASIESPSRLEMKQYADLATAQADIANRNGGELIYVDDIKKTFQVNDDGLGTKTLAEISGGQGGVNYIENSDFEQGIDGYTDDTNFTIAQTELAAEVLRGTASAKLSKAAVDASDEEISVPFTVDRGDLAKKLTISFEYDASDANYADNDILIGVRQNPNGTPSVIRINGEDLKGGKGTHYAQFQTDASIDEYELFFKVNSTNASAYDIIIDDVKVGPRELAKGTIVTDWESYTPTIQGFGTPSNVNFEYKRDGDSIILRGSFQSGSPSATEARIGLPSGLSIKDGLSLSSISPYFKDDNDGVVGAKGGTLIATGGSSFLNFGEDATFSGTNTNPMNILNGNDIAVDSTQSLYFTTTQIPIQGWSSNAVTSEDLGGREVKSFSKISSNQSIAGIGPVKVNFDSIEIDSTSSYDTVNNRFVCPEKGDYQVEASIRFQDIAQGELLNIYVYINGNSSKRVFKDAAITAGAEVLEISDTLHNLSKGDFIEIYAQNNSGNYSILASETDTGQFKVTKLASPQTILETETVAARYTSNSGQSINSTVSTFIYEDLDFDTHSAYDNSTGVYTVPTSGIYQINSIVTASAVTSDNSIFIYVNGSNIHRSRNRVGSGATANSTSGSDIVKVNKGDQIEIRFSCNATTTAIASSDANVFSIARLK